MLQDNLNFIEEDLIHKLVWLDIETGGLTGKNDNVEMGEAEYPILEVAILVGDGKRKLHRIIHIDPKDYSKLSEWAYKTHLANGLLEAATSSNNSLIAVESDIISFLVDCGFGAFAKSGYKNIINQDIIKDIDYSQGYKPAAILAGSSIHFDRSFIRHQMPDLDKFLHYRMLDVSSIGMLTPSRPEPPPANHRAKEDVVDSLNLFKHLITAL